jgi:uncharacterized protein YbjT (DUF2867 family)
MMGSSILVTGATGKQGGAVTRRLIALGHEVHALTRKPDSPAARQLAAEGAKIVAGDFDRPDSLTRAMKDADAVFAMSTPYEAGNEREIKQGLALVDAAKTAGVKHFVYTSVASADRKTGVAHFDSKAVVERHVQASGVPYTIIAPAFFMENVLGPPAIRDGNLTTALPANRRLQMVAVANIGELAALLLDQRDRALGRRIELAGDELTPAQMAEVISRVTGKTVRFVETPLAAVRAFSAELAGMFEWFDRVGYSVDMQRLRSEFPEIQWKGFEASAKEQSWDALLTTSAAHL